MDAYQAIITKRDTRSFTDEPVDEEVVRKVLQAGRMAGSAKNLQPCRFVVVDDDEGKKALAAGGSFAAWIPSAPLLIAVVIPADGREFDAGRSAQNIMLAAHNFGLASCPVTMHDQPTALAAIGAPADQKIAIVIPIGHPAPVDASQPRMQGARIPIDDLVHRGRWHA